jgi:hypothetical protein
MVIDFFSGLSVTGMTETMQNLTKIRGGRVYILQSVKLMCMCRAVCPTNLLVYCSLSHYCT